jgi:O-antigen/teichoic acid export membrane protein
VLQRTWGEDAVGVYHVAYRFAVMLPLIASAPIARVWGPKRFEIAKRDDRDFLLSRGLLYQILAIAAGYLCISLFVGDVVRLMTTPQFYGAAAIVPVVMLAYIFNIMAGNQDIGILVSEKTRYLFVIDWIAAGTAMTGFLLLIPSFGLMGAASATVVAYVVRWGLIYLVSQRLWRVNYQWAPILKVALFTAVPLAGAYLVRFENPWVSFASRVGWVLVFFGAVWWGGLLTERERDWFRAFPGKAYNAAASRLG